ncbi:tryptophan aminotransferase-related protein 4-like [Senna tora]|uniref:Tryptophan aminotransferase-related protein 4-like n=1 Tax=Senna tora TaxID=362788 RepID=A0A834TDV6_9FABA|nr:tryptophan aminotransferase-related protein 4-like [Senna tora]
MRNAMEEAEAVASMSCSGHGRAFLDGVLLHGVPVCECNACYGGPRCSQLLPHCMVDADSGDPTFMEPFWVKNAGSSAIVIPGWHRMSYEFNDGSLISKELKKHIETVHSIVGNAITEGKYIVFGNGATHLLHAAIHALSSQTHHSSSSSSSPTKVVASIPYYPVYKELTEFFNSEDYKFNGDTAMWKKKLEGLNSSFIELVTSPNNPDGKLKEGVLEGPFVKKVHDLAYYWPHFTPIPHPADEDVMIFTLSKLTGHAGSRFGWAIVKDEAVYQKMLRYMDLSTYGVSRETQLRVLKLLKVVLNGNGREMYEFGHNTMSRRWIRLTKVLSHSKRFSIQQLEPQYCSLFQQCEREEDRDCYQVLKQYKVTGRAGSLFGADDRYVRLSLVKSDDDFDLLLQQLKKIVAVSEEQEEKLLIMPLPSNATRKGNDSVLITNYIEWHFFHNNELGHASQLQIEIEGLKLYLVPMKSKFPIVPTKKIVEHDIAVWHGAASRWRNELDGGDARHRVNVRFGELRWRLGFERLWATTTMHRRGEIGGMLCDGSVRRR